MSSSFYDLILAGVTWDVHVQITLCHFEYFIESQYRNCLIPICKRIEVVHKRITM